MIVVVDSEGVLRYESPAVERILGWEPGQRMGLRDDDFVHPDEQGGGVVGSRRLCGQPRRFADGRASPAGFLGAVALGRIDGHQHGGRGDGARDRHQQPGRRRAQGLGRRTDRAGFHDNLTGLANRGLLRNRLETELVRRDRVGAGRPCCLSTSTTSRPSTTVSATTPVIGSLTKSADRLRSCVRPEDLVARLGGDEFAVLVEEGPGFQRRHPHRRAVPRGPSSTLRRLRPRIPCTRQYRHRFLRECDSRCRHAPRQADIAMYHAKANGKAQYAVFSESMHEIVRNRLDVEAGLWAALTGRRVRRPLSAHRCADHTQDRGRGGAGPLAASDPRASVACRVPGCRRGNGSDRPARPVRPSGGLLPGPTVAGNSILTSR